MAHNINLEALFLERYLEIFLFMSQSLGLNDKKCVWFGVSWG